MRRNSLSICGTAILAGLKVAAVDHAGFLGVPSMSEMNAFSVLRFALDLNSPNARYGVDFRVDIVV